MTPVLFNGVLKMQVPMIPWEHLIPFSALHCGLYMGGHTEKAILGIASQCADRLPKFRRAVGPGAGMPS